MEKKNVNGKRNYRKLIDGISTSIISSVNESGFPNTKAMLPPRKREKLKTFYFTTNASSMRVKQYRHNNKACIYFFDKRYFRGIMFIGTMEVLTDQETKNMIWCDGDTMYYPLVGVTDPDYCVLKFSSDRMRIYQNFKLENIGIE